MALQKVISAIIVLSLCFVGCNNQPTLTGKVTFSDDGSPLSKGTVVFLKNDYTARGAITANGTYTVKSDIAKGLPPGTYQVYIDGAENFENGRIIPLIESKFFRAETSGLTLTVDKSQTYDITVGRSTYVPPTAPSAAETLQRRRAATLSGHPCEGGN